MTSMDIDEFRRLLEAEQTRLTAAVRFLEDDNHGSLEDELGELGGFGTDNHIGDTASATFDRELEDGLHDGAAGTLGSVVAALSRIDGGTYGTCTACGQAIPVERLRALPWAAMCIDDQKRFG